MPVATRHNSHYLRLMLAVMVALALMPACIMLVCTTMDAADPACVPHTLSSTDPSGSSGGLAGIGGSLQFLLLAFVAIASTLASTRLMADGAVRSFSVCDGRFGPLPPPRKGSTPLLI